MAGVPAIGPTDSTSGGITVGSIAHGRNPDQGIATTVGASYFYTSIVQPPTMTTTTVTQGT